MSIQLVVIVKLCEYDGVVMGLEGTMTDGPLSEETRKFFLMSKLSPVFRALGVREQLEKVRKIWGCGQIDPQPFIDSDMLHLRLCHIFPEVERIGDHCHSTSVIWNNRAIVTVSILEQGLISSSYTLNPVRVQHYGGVISLHQTRTKEHTLIKILPEPFDKDNPVASKRVLEQQISQITAKNSPMDFAVEAREEIKKDPNMSILDKIYYCPDLLLPSKLCRILQRLHNGS